MSPPSFRGAWRFAACQATDLPLYLVRRVLVLLSVLAPATQLRSVAVDEEA